MNACARFSSKTPGVFGIKINRDWCLCHLSIIVSSRVAMNLDNEMNSMIHDVTRWIFRHPATHRGQCHSGVSL